MVSGSINCIWEKKPRDLLAFTGTLRTMPSEINVGYVIAMPKFTRTLKAEIRAVRKAQKLKFMCVVIMTLSWICTAMLHVTSFHTKQQACDPTEVGPGDVFRRAEVLHVGEIQDDRHEADEDEVGAPHDAQKECGPLQIWHCPGPS